MVHLDKMSRIVGTCAVVWLSVSCQRNFSSASKDRSPRVSQLFLIQRNGVTPQGLKTTFGPAPLQAGRRYTVALLGSPVSVVGPPYSVPTCAFEVTQSGDTVAGMGCYSGLPQADE